MRRDGTDEDVATNTGRDATYLAGREYGVEAIDVVVDGSDIHPSVASAGRAVDGPPAVGTGRCPAPPRKRSE